MANRVRFFDFGMDKSNAFRGDVDLQIVMVAL